MDRDREGKRDGHATDTLPKPRDFCEQVSDILYNTSVIICDCVLLIHIDRSRHFLIDNRLV